ncbi:hypothetical protein ACTOJ1_001222 [Shigella flexneri]
MKKYRPSFYVFSSIIFFTLMYLLVLCLVVFYFYGVVNLYSFMFSNIGLSILNIIAIFLFISLFIISSYGWIKIYNYTKEDIKKEKEEFYKNIEVKYEL